MSNTKSPNSKSNFLKDTDSAPSQIPEYSKYSDVIFIGFVIFVTIILVSSGYLLIRNMGLPVDTGLENEHRQLAEETPKVACELPIRPGSGGSRILKMDEDECVEQKGKIMWYIEQLPSNIPHDKYIDCLLPGESAPVFMKAGSCLNSQGRIINAP